MGQVSPFKGGGEHTHLINVVSKNIPHAREKVFTI